MIELGETIETKCLCSNRGTRDFVPDRYVHTSALSDEGFGQQSCDGTIVAVKMMYENFRHTHGSGSGAGEINVEPGFIFFCGCTVLL